MTGPQLETGRSANLGAPPPLPEGGLRIIPLGGLGAIGRNMTVFEYNGKLLVVDCGVLFPDVDSPGVDSLVEMLTMRMSPEEVLVAARVDLDDSFTVDELEKASEEVERRVREAHPEVRHVFLDPTDDPDEH